MTIMIQHGIKELITYGIIRMKDFIKITEGNFGVELLLEQIIWMHIIEIAAIQKKV